MYNFSDPQQDQRIIKALLVLRNTPYHLISEGKERKYRKEVIEQYKISEEAISTFIGMNEFAGLSLDEHALEIREKAHEYRAEFREKVNKALGLCINEEEQLECLERFSCHYSVAPFKISMWERHYPKTLEEFAQWHIEQGGWQGDFQGLKFDDFARGWALYWMSEWISEQIGGIVSKRIDEAERQASQKALELQLSPTTIDESYPTTERLLAPVLHITPSARKALHDALCKYIDEKDNLALSVLIFKEEVPNSQITVTCLVKEFGLTFFRTEAVPKDGAKLLSEQLPRFFKRNDGKKIVDLKPSNLVKYLLGGRKM